MSARTKILKSLSAAIALAAVVSAVPVKAAPPLLVSTTKFSLTFQDGWATFPFSSDTIKFVMNQSLSATCYLTAVPQTRELTAQEIAAYMAMYGGSDSLVQTATGTKTLGGKTFSFVEFKDVDDSSGRARFYYTSTGSLLFNATTAFDVDNSAAVIAQVEAALATLTLNSGASLRAAALRGQGFRPATHDVLGRSGQAVRPVRLFRMPAL